MTDTEHIDPEAPCPVVGRPVPGFGDATAADPGIVEQQVAHAVHVVDLLRARFDRIGPRHIGDDSRHLALSFESAERFVEHRLLDVGDDNLRAFFEQRFDQAFADTARAAGDDRDLALEVLH